MVPLTRNLSALASHRYSRSGHPVHHLRAIRESNHEHCQANREAIRNGLNIRIHCGTIHVPHSGLFGNLLLVAPQAHQKHRLQSLVHIHCCLENAIGLAFYLSLGQKYQGGEEKSERKLHGLQN